MVNQVTNMLVRIIAFFSNPVVCLAIVALLIVSLAFDANDRDRKREYTTEILHPRAGVECVVLKGGEPQLSCYPVSDEVKR